MQETGHVQVDVVSLDFSPNFKTMAPYREPARQAAGTFQLTSGKMILISTRQFMIARIAYA